MARDNVINVHNVLTVLLRNARARVCVCAAGKFFFFGPLCALCVFAVVTSTRRVYIQRDRGAAFITLLVKYRNGGGLYECRLTRWYR